MKQAEKLVYGDRQQDYGHPKHDFQRTAAMWSAILGHLIKPEQVPLCMIAVKLSRLVKSPDKMDSVVDIAGYSECYAMCIKEEE